MKVFIIALIFSACVMAQTPLPSPYAASVGNSGTITSITAGCGLSGGTITTSGTIAESVTVTAHNGSYAILTGDCGKALTTNTTATWTLPQAGSAGFASGWATEVNVSSGTLTITTTTSNFYGASGASATTLTITGPAGATITSDGTNWLVQAGGSGTPSFTAITSGTNTTATMTVGSGASLAAAGSGSITATAAPASGLTGQVSGANGGTGANNGTSTITVGGNVTFSGAYTFTGTLAGNTNVTFPTSGTLATTVVPLSTGTSGSLPSGSGFYVCTSTCTVTPPVPAAGYQYCVYNADNVSTVITLAALGSSARYENTARTAYGTAGTGTLVSGGAVGDAVCIVGLDSTHYLTVYAKNTWTVN